MVKMGLQNKRLCIWSTVQVNMNVLGVETYGDYTETFAPTVRSPAILYERRNCLPIHLTPDTPDTPDTHDIPK